MRLTKGGITVEITYPGEIRRYKALGFVEAKPVVPSKDFAAQQQQIVEDALQPHKKKSAGSTPAEKDTK